MAVTKGRDGVVRSGATNAVLEVISFTAEETADEIEVKAMGDTFKRFEDGLIDMSGQVVVNWDQADTTGQNTLVVGANIDLRLYPEGIASGANYLSPENQTPATVKILGNAISAEVDGIVGRTFSWRGGMAWESVP